MALKFIIWSTTEPTVALICACLPPMRKLFTTRIAKVSSYVSPIRLDLRKPQPDESMSKVELSRANRNLANHNSVPPSPKSSLSSRLANSRQSSVRDSQIENAASRDNLQEEKMRLGHHVRMTKSTGSDEYPSGQMKAGLSASETSQEVQSSARSDYGVNVKKPG